MHSLPAVHQQLRFAHLASGTRIAWASSGQGPTLVRAAHWMTHVQHDHESPIWRPWLQRLGQEVQLVRYDERGCGLSGPDDSPLGLAAALEELEVVVDAAGKQPVALLGMSGAVAPVLAYAARHPARVSHLLLLGGYTHGLLHRQPKPEQLALHEAIVQLIRLGWGQRDAAVQQFFTAQMIPDATPEQAHALNEQQRLSCSGERAAAILRARVALDVRELLPQVRCPTLVMHCEGDGVVAVERGRGGANWRRRSLVRALRAFPLETTSLWPASPRSSASAPWSATSCASAALPVRVRPSRRVSASCWPWWRRVWTICRSPPVWAWPRRRCAMGCPGSTARSAWKVVLRRSCGRANSGLAERDACPSR